MIRYTCKLKVKEEKVDAKFYGIFQVSEVLPPSPMIGGHNGGVLAQPVAVIEYEGELIKVNTNLVSEIREVTE